MGERVVEHPFRQTVEQALRQAVKQGLWHALPVAHVLENLREAVWLLHCLLQHNARGPGEAVM